MKAATSARRQGVPGLAVLGLGALAAGLGLAGCGTSTPAAPATPASSPPASSPPAPAAAGTGTTTGTGTGTGTGTTTGTGDAGQTTAAAPAVTKTVVQTVSAAPPATASAPAAAPPAAQPAAPPGGPNVTDPWAVVSAYYGDIDSGDYAQAYALIGNGATTGQSYQQFAAGYSCTGAQVVSENWESGDQVNFDLTADDTCAGTTQYYTGTDTVENGTIVAAEITQTG